MLELVPLMAVGALDGEDAANWQALLPPDAERAAAELARFQDIAVLMGVVQSSPCQPPPSLKGKIMARIQSGSQVQKPAVSSSNPSVFVGRNEGLWQALPIPGVRVKNLTVDDRRGASVKLYELAPGARFPEHHHSGSEECYVLAGDFHLEGRVLYAGDFMHAEAGCDHHESFTEHGCTLLVMVS